MKQQICTPFHPTAKEDEIINNASEDKKLYKKLHRAIDKCEFSIKMRWMKFVFATFPPFPWTRRRARRAVVEGARWDFRGPLYSINGLLFYYLPLQYFKKILYINIDLRKHFLCFWAIVLTKYITYDCFTPNDWPVSLVALTIKDHPG